MVAAIVWGLVQGLTEFLPVSSSGHLIVVPAILSRLGWEVPDPGLAVSAVLHLGTLAAVLAYFRTDVSRILRFRGDPEGRRLGILVLVGTIPAGVGFFIKGPLDTFGDDVRRVGWALLGTALILVAGQAAASGARRLAEGRIADAWVVGLAQALALIPGISRSGITIAAGAWRRFTPTEAARFAFLLGIPAIAAAGLTSIGDVASDGDFGAELLVGMAVAAISGYAAIAALLTALRRVGLFPFAGYCFVVGLVAILVL